MESEQELTYTAVITITLPNSQTAAAHVTLTPPATIATDGRVKQLRDCTLADLRDFADQMEAAVWETVQAIKLVELAEQDESQVEVNVLDEEGKPFLPLPNWPKQKVILPPTPEEQELEKEEHSQSKIKNQKSEIVGISVLESEPVIEEREAGDDPAAFPTPAVAPSQARVRIAGERRPTGDPTWAAVDILIDEPAFRAAQAHALGSLNREVAGILVGPPPEKQPDGRYVVHIIDTIIAKHTVMHGASVTYTPESWRYIHDRLAEKYPDETAVIVGWYHTHPGFGIFLSGMDLFIHQNFFTQKWHTALVLDPIAYRSGFFCWNRMQTKVRPYELPWPNWAENSW